jgi:hypothetical protein
MLRRRAASHIDGGLPDDQWLSASYKVFRERIDRYYGTPETVAWGGDEQQPVGDFGVALYFYAKSIDILHTAYGFSQMQSRRPSSADVPILDRFCGALEMSLGAHPDAPVEETVREVTHRLRSISMTCDSSGINSQPYREALDRIGRLAPNVPVDDVLWV